MSHKVVIGGLAHETNVFSRFWVEFQEIADQLQAP